MYIVFRSRQKRKRDRKPEINFFLKMKFVFYYLLVLIATQSCITVRSFNADMRTLRNPEKLKKDVAFAQRKLIKLHPELYQYISKEGLTAKFDSVTAALDTPITSNDFFFRLSPVISAVRQGHARLWPLYRKLTYKESMLEDRRGISPLSKLNFVLDSNKLIVTRNNLPKSPLVPGTEIKKINGLTPDEILTPYKPTFGSDGFNTTYIRHHLEGSIPLFLYFRQGTTDSIHCEIIGHDSASAVTINFPVSQDGTFFPQTPEEIVAHKAERKRKKLQGYNYVTEQYSKSLGFTGADNSIALLRILDFASGRYSKFYEKTFALLDSLQTQNLILDLRDNPGGNLNDAVDLYSYLAEKDFQFIDASIVSSKTSLLSHNFFRNKTFTQGAFTIPFIPLIATYMGVTWCKVHKNESGQYTCPFKEAKLQQVKSTRFKGKLYVMINGGSFSAASLLASNLKGSGRGIFVGEETGGAYNGCVAGAIRTYVLPHSKLPITFGLISIQPHYKSEIVGRGIFPDVEIKPTIEERIKQMDPELQWILDDIERKHY